MHKLNRKGYLTVEIVLASVVAFLIAFFLFDITMKLVDVTNDAYFDTEFIADKALIIKNIKNEIESDIKSICSSGSDEIVLDEMIIDDTSPYISFQYINSNTGDDIYEELKIDRIDNDNVISFGDYSKKINDKLTNFSIDANNYADYLMIKISSDNIFSDNDYNINIIINKSCN